MKTLQGAIQSVAAAGLLFVSVSAATNDITDAIAAAQKHYAAGELSQAIAQLDYAGTLVRQEKAERVTTAFPPAPAGWEADEPESDVAGAAMFGGGISVSRNYYNDNASIEMQMMMDSPMLQAFSMMLSNPSMIAMSGGKLIKIQGLQAVQKVEGDSAEIQFVTANGAMITLNTDANQLKTALALANAIDLKKL